jgi:cell division protein FtsI (penicillin-binding protein 3)
VAAYAGAGLIAKTDELPATDAAIQKITDAALTKGVRESKARAGFALVTDAKSGKVLAIDFVDGRKHSAAERNKLLADYLRQPMFPWSTLKPIVAALAIDTGKTKITDEHDCGNGVYNTAGKMFTDHTPFAKLTTSETLVQSSNICAIKIGEKLGVDGITAGLQRFGLTAPTPEELKNPLFVPLTSFGIGSQFTTEQIAHAYGAIANGGLLPDGRRAISAATATQLRETLERVVTEGTGKKAAATDYTTAGKTGTGRWERILDDRDHDRTQEVAVFVGFAPAHDPKIVISVHVEKPKVGDTQGGRHAAPIFASIAEGALKAMGVKPDKAR